MIKGLLKTLPERGKIKIGRKGKLTPTKNNKEFRLPEKLSHFVITTLERDKETDNFILDKTIHKKLGQEPKRIPILFLYDDIDANFMTRYSAYSGRTCVCKGDGEKAERMVNTGGEIKEFSCPCAASDPGYVQDKKTEGHKFPKCKMNGVLQCLIRDSEDLGGVHKFRTTSYNSVRGIVSTLSFFQALTKGRLAGLPFDLVLTPKTAEAPTGGAVNIFVVGVAYAGTLADLYRTSNQLKLEDAKYGYNVKAIEEHAKKILTFDDREVNEIVEEFYPEQAKETKRVIIPDEDITVDGVDKKGPSKIEEPGKTDKPAADSTGKPPEKPKADKPARRKRTAASGKQAAKPEGTGQIENPEGQQNQQQKPADPGQAPDPSDPPEDENQGQQQTDVEDDLNKVF